MEKKKKIELIKLTIQIGDTKVQVTKEEAKDLHKALSELFGEKQAANHYHYNRPWYWPNTFYGSSLDAFGSGGLGLNLQGSAQGLGSYDPYGNGLTAAGNLEYKTDNVTISSDSFKIED